MEVTEDMLCYRDTLTDREDKYEFDFDFETNNSPKGTIIGQMML